MRKNTMNRTNRTDKQTSHEQKGMRKNAQHRLKNKGNIDKIQNKTLSSMSTISTELT
jgi:hypothetical protein